MNVLMLEYKDLKPAQLRTGSFSTSMHITDGLISQGQTILNVSGKSRFWNYV